MRRLLGGGAVLCEFRGQRALLHDRPEKTDQLARDRDDGHLRAFPHCDAVIEFVQPMLRLPGVRDDQRRLAALPAC